MVYRPDVRDDLCFVLMPFSSPFPGYFDHIIRPACAEVGLTAVKADDIYGTRAVIQDIWEYIWKSRAVVAVVSGRNPNVNYELGICHTLGVPAVLLTDKAEDVPFDYRHRRYIQYQTTEAQWEVLLRERLVSTLRAVLDDASQNDETLPWPYSTEKLVKEALLDEVKDEKSSRREVASGVAMAMALMSSAIGPEGKGIAQGTAFSDPVIIRSGARMIESLSSGKILVRQGIDAMKRLARDVNDVAGDYTKTSVLVAAKMVELAEIELLQGRSATRLIAGMQAAMELALAQLRTTAMPVTYNELRPVAFAASRDSEIAEVVARSVQEAGSDGLVQIELTQDQRTSLEVIHGMHFDRGFLSPAFTTDKIRKEVVLTDCRVLLYEPRIGNMRDLLPILEAAARTSTPILVISSQIDGEALSTLVVNAEKGTLQCAAIQTPGFGDRRRHQLEDLAVYTGGRAFFQEDGIPLASIDWSQLGTAKRVVINESFTTMLGGGGDATEIATRTAELKERLRRTSSSFDQEKIRERLAHLAASIVTIKIGGVTESDRAEAQYASETALYTSQSALAHGCVLGAGVALARAKLFIDKAQSNNDAESRGMQIVSEALSQPLRSILTSSGIADSSTLLKHLINDEGTNTFNASKGIVEDASIVGIFDAVDSLRTALTLAMAHCKSILQASSWSIRHSHPS